MALHDKSMTQTDQPFEATVTILDGLIQKNRCAAAPDRRAARSTDTENKSGVRPWTSNKRQPVTRVVPAAATRSGPPALPVQRRRSPILPARFLTMRY